MFVHINIGFDKGAKDGLREGVPKESPPPLPQFGQLVKLFSDVEIQDLKVSLELKILYILYNILYILFDHLKKSW